MVTLALAVVAGLVLGLARPPTGLHAARPRVCSIGLLGVGAALNAASVVLDGAASVIALVASLAVLIAVATANRHLTGMAVIGVGLLVNLVAVAANAGMPVRPGALEAAGIVADGATAEVDAPRHIESADDPLPVLGDVLPVGTFGEVLSFGDLIVVLGAADAVRELSRRRGRAKVPAAAQRPGATARTRLDQVWGTAPRGAPVAATQYSAKPDRSAPATIDLASAAAVPSAPDLVAASHSR